MTHAIQISTKLSDGTILVVGAEGPDELGIHLQALGLDCERVLARFSALEGLGDPVAVAQAGLGATVIPASAQPAQSGDPRLIQRPPGVEKLCAHGVRDWVSGISPKNNQPYAMWACPQPKGAGDKCAAEFYRAR